MILKFDVFLIHAKFSILMFFYRSITRRTERKSLKFIRCFPFSDTNQHTFHSVFYLLRDKKDKTIER